MAAAVEFAVAVYVGVSGELVGVGVGVDGGVAPDAVSSMVTFAASESTLPSFTVKVKLSAPL